MSDPWESTKEFVWCPSCEKARNAEVMSAVQDRNVEHGPPSLITLMRCDGCGQALLFGQEDYGNGWDELFRLWPDPPRPLSPSIPDSLRHEHEEARKCFEAKAYTAAVVMVGRTLEGVCAEHGFAKGTLHQRLQQMKSKDLIDPRLLEWAEELRVLRNEGAHFTGSQVSREDSKDALELSEALLDYTYVLASRFDAFRTRRASRQDINESAE